MMLALSDVVWQTAIQVTGGLALAWMAQRAASKVEQVKSTLQVVTAKQEDHLAAQDAVLESVAGKIEQVHIATNSMKDQLVQKTEDEAFARGGVQERARADAQKKT